MSDQAIIHVTAEGDRWDLLAWRYYRDAYAYERIVAANQDAPILPVLPAGLLLRIPVIEASETLAEALPPWKR